jgi:hypothetical protein
LLCGYSLGADKTPNRRCKACQTINLWQMWTICSTECYPIRIFWTSYVSVNRAATSFPIRAVGDENQPLIVPTVLYKFDGTRKAVPVRGFP